MCGLMRGHVPVQLETNIYLENVLVGSLWGVDFPPSNRRAGTDSFGGTCCSVTQLCLTLWDPMDCSTPGLPVPHQLLELAQTHVH